MTVTLSGIRVISLVGYQGSGKSTLGKKLARALRTDFVETSSVVKFLFEHLNRAELPKTAKLTHHDPDWLGKAVALYIGKAASEQNRTIVILTGVREQQVHDYLAAQGANLVSIEIKAQPALRMKRVMALGKVETVNEFIEHELNEKKMGLEEVCQKAPLQIETKDEIQPQTMVRAIIGKLEKEGFKCN